MLQREAIAESLCQTAPLSAMIFIQVEVDLRVKPTLPVHCSETLNKFSYLAMATFSDKQRKHKPSSSDLIKGQTEKIQYVLWLLGEWEQRQVNDRLDRRAKNVRMLRCRCWFGERKKLREKKKKWCLIYLHKKRLEKQFLYGGIAIYWDDQLLVWREPWNNLSN